MPGEFITDGIGPLPYGMDAGKNPHLLQKTQTAKSFNATHRGAYITHRPSLRKIRMTFFGDIKDTATKKLFQGAGYYGADSSVGSLLAQIGGRLFQFTPDSIGGSTVLDISIPGDPNPQDILQVWIWQGENFGIIQDGQSAPIFFNGITSRRSLSVQKVLGTTAVNFTVPGIGLIGTATLVTAFAGKVGDQFLINGATYEAADAPGGVVPIQAHLTNITDVVGTVRAVGAKIYSNPNVVAIPQVSSTVGGGDYPTGELGLVLDGDNTIPRLNTVAFPGQAVSYGAFNFTVTNNVLGTGRFGLVSSQSYFIDPVTFYQLVPILKRPAIAPLKQVAVIASPYTVPAIGVTSIVNIQAEYTGSANKLVQIGNFYYKITAIPTVPLGTVIGVKNITDVPGTVISFPVDMLSIPELPPGRMGAYVMGRIWMALTDGKGFMASDIVGGSSGTLANNFRDAILRATENGYLAGGGNFRVPGNNGDITAIKAVAILDVSLGQGPVQIFTPLSIFSCNAPVDRLSWQSITNPILTESLIGGGSLSQNGTVNSNADILFRSLEGIRSYILSRADFDKWSSTPISREVQPIVDTENKALIQFSSAVVFDNRCLVSAIPIQGPLGVYCRGIYALNFDTISSLRGKESSVYDGFWSGLNVLQFVTGLFNGVQRAFAFCYEEATNEISLYEILPGSADNIFDNGNVGITWGFETASLFNDPKVKGEFDPIELIDGEVYFSEIRGAVNIQVWYKPDYLECWVPWRTFSICANNVGTGKERQYRPRLGLGSPDIEACDVTNNRPYRIGNNFQVKFQITGSCKFMGAQFKANRALDTKYSIVECDKICDTSEPVDCETVIRTDCLNLPLNFYSLNFGKTYTNAATLVVVTDPNGSQRNVPIPSGAVSFSFPYPPDYRFEYPISLFLCAAGGMIANEIPAGATQEQIDAIAQSVVSQCVQAIAESGVACEPVVKYNEEVFTEPCPNGEPFNFTGTLPSWITINGDSTRFTGRPGVFSAPTVDEANAKAQEALGNFQVSAFTSGALACGVAPPCVFNAALLSNCYQITGYAVGLIPGVPSGCDP